MLFRSLEAQMGGTATSGLLQSITAIDARVTEEAKARSDAIAAEASQRTALAATLRTETDQKVSAGVSAEASARTTATDALSRRLGTVEADYTTGGAVDAKVNAKVSEEAQARTTAISGEASARNALAATLRGETDSKVSAAVTAEQDARVTAQQAIARRQDALEATAGTSGNLLSNSDFLPNTEGWAFVSESGTVTALNGFSPTNYYPPRVNTLIMYQPNGSANRAGFWYEDVTGVEGNAIYQASAYLASHRCTSQVYVDCYNPAGANVGTFAVTASEGNAGNQQVSDFRRVFVNFTAPAGTSYVRFHIIKNGTRDGLSDSYVWFFRPQLTKAGSIQSPAVPYSSGGAGGPLVSADARITAQSAALADLPNKYAAASRAGLLEAQLRREQPSALNSYVDAVSGSVGQVRTDMVARIEDRASAIADAKAGAVAQTVSQLRSEYDGTASTVRTQAGAISAIDGRQEVYWGVTGTTADGKVAIGLRKKNGEAGEFLVDTNMRVTGDAIFEKSVTTGKIADNAISAMVGAQAGNYAIPYGQNGTTYGVSVTIPNPTGGPVRVDFRYSVGSGGPGSASVNVQIQRVAADGSEYNFSDASYIGGIILDYPPAGASVTYRFKFQNTGSGSGQTTIIYQQLFALQMKR